LADYFFYRFVLFLCLSTDIFFGSGRMAHRSRLPPTSTIPVNDRQHRLQNPNLNFYAKPISRFVR
jgi:hypothetical protein